MRRLGGTPASPSTGRSLHPTTTHSALWVRVALEPSQVRWIRAEPGRAEPQLPVRRALGEEHAVQRGPRERGTCGEDLPPPPADGDC